MRNAIGLCIALQEAAMLWKSTGLIAAAVLLATAGDVSATILPPFTYGGHTSIAYWDGTQYIQPLEFNTGPSQSLSGSAVSSASASSSSALAPLPTVSATADVSGPTAFDITATAIADITLTYYLEVVGPPGMVPLDVRAAGTVSGTPNGGGIANFSTCLGVGDLQSSSWTLNTTATVAANNPYCVEIEAKAQAFEDGILDTAAHGSVTVDPHFAIDPGFLLAPDYTLVFSDGIGNGAVSAAPEPAMTLAVIAALGFLARSRTRGRVR